VSHTHGPVYDNSCPDCQVASVHARRPSRPLQMAHIDYLVKYHGVNRDELVARLTNG
jgi:hypothetical protein